MQLELQKLLGRSQVQPRVPTRVSLYGNAANKMVDGPRPRA
jgi:hypothetical protein